MGTILNLSKMDGTVYVYLGNETVREKFLADANREGFTFSDGKDMGERPAADLYVVKPVKVEYEKYILGFEDYLE